MTTATTTPATPTFPTISPRAVLVRGLGLLALCTVILGLFLAEVWRAPQRPEDIRAAAAAAHVQPRT